MRTRHCLQHQVIEALVRFEKIFLFVVGVDAVFARENQFVVYLEYVDEDIGGKSIF
jgi:hypothetical protein